MPTPADDAPGAGPEILFYHLELARLKDVLPMLLDKSLQRGWRVAIEAADRRQVEELDDYLWTFSEESFLPHGAAEDGFAERQPVYLTDSADNPNAAAIRFYVGGAEPGEVEGYARIVYLFDGTNDERVAAARRQWKRLSGEGRNVTYWRQNERGGWEKKA
jgi:DNA polymerase-3 subunit chi